MYTTKCHSEFKAIPEVAMQPPPEGPCSGYVVVKEEDPDEETCTCCLVLCPNMPDVRYLPIPQNKTLSFRFTSPEGEISTTATETVLFVPVINLPLSANRYYAVAAKGEHQGLVHTCSKEDDMSTSCFGQVIQDVKPKPFDHRDIYQKIEIIPHRGRFTAKSVASDGIPPWIFRQKYWPLHESKPEIYQLGEALDVNQSLRLNYLELNTSTSVITGKWFCPFFFFLKERADPPYQMKRSMFYEVTLEQFWKEVYSGIEKMSILLRGEETMREEMESNDGFLWFRKTGVLNGERIGLNLALWEMIKWEENRGGWDDQGTGAILEELRLGDYVLVERFSFERLNGTVVLALDFLHTDKVRTK
ncbi:uncharacterized protein LOC144573619 [Carex rostrata]